MSTAGGPKVIADNTLALHLDAGSTKSFPGEPTTNVVTNTNLDTGWAKGYQTNIVFNEIEPPEGINSPVVGHDRGNSSGYWYSYGNYAPQDPSTTYTVSLYVKTRDSNFRIRFYTADNSETGRVWGSYITVPNDGNWHRLVWDSFTNPSNSQSDSLSFNFSYNGSIGESITRTWFCAPQMEVKSYATPFVVGTRGTTVATGGGWVDRSGNSNHGELVNGPTYNSNGLGGLVFDGTNDHIQIANDVLSTNSPFTLEGWIKPNGSSWGNNSFPLYNTYRNSSSIGFWHHFGTDNILRWRHAGSSYTTGDLSGIGLVANVWQLTTITWDGDTLRLYKNGLLQNSTSAAGGYNTSSTTGGRIGMLSYRSNGSDYNWNGTIGTNLVYNRALTASEVLQNYNATKGRFGL